MKNNALVAIAVVLVVILGVQAYTLYRLNDRVDRLTAQNQSTETSPGVRPNVSKPAPPPLPNEDFFNSQPWNPYEEMQRMQEEMEKMFGESFSRFHLNTPLGTLSRTPDVDLQDKADHYLVTVNAPGADESSIAVKLDGQLLNITIKTEQGKQQDDDKNGSYRYRERFVGEFHRVLTLPGPVDAERMKTEYRNGVLSITVPKK
ncbi:Hsp20/alpha crystallin family protein [Methylomonas methanica]|uniref:Heat shock protein Hsp20 n=1 Tax=Methylomonas methanica (strain DSM 25384 / MC09) TaxID=857087 RepID=F9ZXH5_METMM|nr:Hsp20/alpha crystallin family protein [Methylomonas methanica]AEG00963.1 heat shock protein Hsp20 [Methylomonas methanica MC09]